GPDEAVAASLVIIGIADAPEPCAPVVCALSRMEPDMSDFRRPSRRTLAKRLPDAQCFSSASAGLGRRPVCRPIRGATVVAGAAAALAGFGLALQSGQADTVSSSSLIVES